MSLVNRQLKIPYKIEYKVLIKKIALIFLLFAILEGKLSIFSQKMNIVTISILHLLILFIIYTISNLYLKTQIKISSFIFTKFEFKMFVLLIINALANILFLKSTHIRFFDFNSTNIIHRFIMFYILLLIDSFTITYILKYLIENFKIKTLNSIIIKTSNHFKLFQIILKFIWPRSMYIDMRNLIIPIIFCSFYILLGQWNEIILNPFNPLILLITIPILISAIFFKPLVKYNKLAKTDVVEDDKGILPSITFITLFSIMLFCIISIFLSSIFLLIFFYCYLILVYIPLISISYDLYQNKNANNQN